MQMQGERWLFFISQFEENPEIIVEKSNLIAHFQNHSKIRSKITTKKVKKITKK